MTTDTNDTIKNLKDVLKSYEDDDGNAEEFSSFGEELIVTDYLDPTDFMQNVSPKFDNNQHLNVMQLNIDNLTTKMDSFL
jgi:hypothetical protein